MAKWSNWSGRHRCEAGLRFLRSEEDAAALAAEAAATGRTLRVAGAGHSHAPLVPNGDLIADVSGLSGVVTADAATKRAWIRAGTPIHALGPALRDAGLALHNQGDIDRQTLAGAVATGTHGTGHELSNLSAAVTGARVALASGELVDCGPDRHPELWQAARLSLGALGIVTRLELQLREAYRLAERSERLPFTELAASIEARSAAGRHFEFFWRPIEDVAFVKRIDETDREPEYPLAREGARVAWSYEVLPSHRDWRHTELEYSLPAAAGPAAMAEIRSLLRSDFPDMPWPVEYRTLAQDDVWLSTAYRRPTVTISLHQAVEEDEAPMFRAAERILLDHGGRPHWGKVSYVEADRLAAMYERWDDWWRVRDEHDPGDTFLNDHLRSIRG
ncbi:MAG: D-arabinono-1,4-lactone oxidase [Thermoanaerobaculia bacterium]|nr:D-arabinono-1,4-lactone oxidase [Thermoanaerobaculia bacterium]